MTDSHGRPPLSRREKLALTVASLVVLAVSAAVAAYMMINRPKPERRRPVLSAPIVRVQTISSTSHEVDVPVMGTVVPAVAVDLKTRVAGQVVWTHPEFIEGGIVRKGEVLVRLDPVDYELALTRKKAVLETAVNELKAEQGRQEIARSEWEILGLEDNASEMDRELALRKPQLAERQAALEAARAEVRQAELDLERTLIRAPFNAVVRSTHVDVGSQVSAQAALAELVGVDAYHVQALIPLDRLKWVILPDEGGAAGSRALVRSGSGHERQGRLLKLMGDLEPGGRLARLLIEVEDPLDLAKNNGQRTPMLLGDYVSVQIQGRKVEDVYVIDLAHLKDGNMIYTVDGENRLRIQEVDVVWRGAEQVLARGLEPGQRLVVSDLSAPVEGMEVRVQGEDAAPADKGNGEREAGKE